MSQPESIKTDGVAIWDLVVNRMKSRDAIGRRKYGVPLQADNGRDHLEDAVEEALVSVVYLCAEIEKRRINAAD